MGSKNDWQNCLLNAGLDGRGIVNKAVRVEKAHIAEIKEKNPKYDDATIKRMAKEQTIDDLTLAVKVTENSAKMDVDKTEKLFEGIERTIYQDNGKGKLKNGLDGMDVLQVLKNYLVPDAAVRIKGQYKNKSSQLQPEGVRNTETAYHGILNDLYEPYAKISQGVRGNVGTMTWKKKYKGRSAQELLLEAISTGKKTGEKEIDEAVEAYDELIDRLLELVKENTGIEVSKLREKYLPKGYVPFPVDVRRMYNMDKDEFIKYAMAMEPDKSPEEFGEIYDNASVAAVSENGYISDGLAFIKVKNIPKYLEFIKKTTGHNEILDVINNEIDLAARVYSIKDVLGDTDLFMRKALALLKDNGISGRNEHGGSNTDLGHNLAGTPFLNLPQFRALLDVLKGRDRQTAVDTPMAISAKITDLEDDFNIQADYINQQKGFELNPRKRDELLDALNKIPDIGIEGKPGYFELIGPSKRKKISDAIYNIFGEKIREEDVMQIFAPAGKRSVMPGIEPHQVYKLDHQKFIINRMEKRTQEIVGKEKEVIQQAVYDVQQSKAYKELEGDTQKAIDEGIGLTKEAKQAQLRHDVAVKEINKLLKKRLGTKFWNGVRYNASAIRGLITVAKLGKVAVDAPAEVVLGRFILRALNPRSGFLKDYVGVPKSWLKTINPARSRQARNVAKLGAGHLDLARQAKAAIDRDINTSSALSGVLHGLSKLYTEKFGFSYVLQNRSSSFNMDFIDTLGELFDQGDWDKLAEKSRNTMAKMGLTKDIYNIVQKEWADNLDLKENQKFSGIPFPQLNLRKIKNPQAKRVLLGVLQQADSRAAGDKSTEHKAFVARGPLSDGDVAKHGSFVREMVNEPIWTFKSWATRVFSEMLLPSVQSMWKYRNHTDGSADHWKQLNLHLIYIASVYGVYQAREWLSGRDPDDKTMWRQVWDIAGRTGYFGTPGQFMQNKYTGDVGVEAFMDNPFWGSLGTLTDWINAENGNVWDHIWGEGEQTNERLLERKRKRARKIFSPEDAFLTQIYLNRIAKNNESSSNSNKTER